MSIQAAANIREAYRFPRNAIKHACLDAAANPNAGSRPRMVLPPGIANPSSVLAIALRATRASQAASVNRRFCAWSVVKRVEAAATLDLSAAVPLFTSP